ncbi:Hypothetical protein ETEE_1751 [Edwardsiella anguillarum ET080813]|uniref:Uncharacterized protein n=1 Tax=Edwardsiella anguillarum ET080813 TaxID=667120 RepID=A0A076LRG8_9GAMM|nr:Hypothetical protein ETEE_1751 [Edwardsiella anguillarum ET080813]
MAFLLLYSVIIHQSKNVRLELCYVLAKKDISSILCVR